MNMTPTTTLEKTSLEAHVDLCAIRYQQLDTRLGKLEEDMSKIQADILQGHKSLKTTIITSSSSIVVALIGVLTAILIKLP